MSFPVDIPNPNQDNVFYTIPALKSELLNWFDVDKIKVVEDKYKDYYLPTFVFDPAGAPTVYNLDVYPKDGQKESLQFDQVGNIIDEIKIPKPQPKPPELEKLNDGGFGCELDPKFYVDTLLKEPNDITFEQETSTESLDLLLSTKYQHDPVLGEKLQNFAILKNLLLGQLKIIPEKELNSFKEKYKSTLETVDLFLASLGDVLDGQKRSLDGLKYENFYQTVYNQTDKVRTSKRGLEGTQMILGQALADLGNIFEKVGDGYKIRIGSTRNDGSSRGQVNKGSRINRSPDRWGHTVWPDFLEVLEKEGHLQNFRTTVPPKGLLNALGPDFDGITKYDGVSVFSEEGKPQDWYYNNLKRAISNGETTWTGLEEFISEFDLITEKYIQKATMDSLGGQHMLVDQAIMKAILKLCMTNLDVNEYAPRTSGDDNFFSTIGRSASLGPSGVSPWPSKETIDPDSYTVQPYTNNGFLCYHALVALVARIGRDSDEMEFLVDNITEPESNYDELIKVVKKVNFGSEHPNNFKDSISGVNRDLLHLLHLYPKGDTFPVYSHSYLIAKEDDVPISERTFIGWNLKPADHTTEHEVMTGYVDETNYNLLGTDHSEAIISSGSDIGKVKYASLPNAYRSMGFIERGEGQKNRRENFAYFGIGKSLRNKEEVKDVLSFWKQRKYSMPYFWASMTSLWRALSVETCKNMIDSVNDIQDTDIKLTNEEILEKFDHATIWMRIKQIFVDLRNDSEIQSIPYVSPDGTISFTERSDTSFDFNKDVQNRNTPGQNTRLMMQEFVRFVSVISNFNSVQTVSNHSPIDFDYVTYLPHQGLTLPTNINFSNSHGGAGQYLQPSFDPYYDKLEFTPHELQKGELIKKHLLPVVGNVPDNFITRYNLYLSRTTMLHRHVELFAHLKASLRAIKTFVAGFSVPQRIQDAIVSGQIDIVRDLDDPAALITQIDSYKTKYQANELGLGRRWDWTLDSNAIEASAEEEQWLYVQVLGLKKECFDEGTVTLVPEYIMSDSVVAIPSATINVTPFDKGKVFDQRSELLLRWLHVSAGLDLCELTFSKDTSMIYSKELIESESEIFPWKKDDFEEGIPLKPLETIYNMSPWLFSQNMFNDICVPNTYHRVVACIISKKHLEESGIGLERIDGTIDDIIGSIRWKKI